MATGTPKASFLTLPSELRQDIIRHATALYVPNLDADHKAFDAALQANITGWQTTTALRATCHLICNDLQVILELDIDKARSALANRSLYTVLTHAGQNFCSPWIETVLQKVQEAFHAHDLTLIEPYVTLQAYVDFWGNLERQIERLPSFLKIWEAANEVRAKARST